jgi:drug/metabolite transporter (DMT)-like permease
MSMTIKMRRLSPLTRAVLCALAAVFFLFSMNVIAKTMADIYTPMEAAFWRNAMSTLVLLPFVLTRFGPRFPPMGQPQTMVTRSVLGSLTLMLSMGACGALGQYLNAMSYKLADASFVGIFVYTQLLWAIPFDYFLWDHAPHLSTLVGGGVIVMANIAMIVTERRRKAAVKDPCTVQSATD